MAIPSFTSNSPAPIPQPQGLPDPESVLSTPAMGLAEAQQDMREAHLAGAPAVFASSLAWLTAGWVALQVSTPSAIVALLAGGALIQPVGIALSRILGRSGSSEPGNPLSRLALEGAAWLVICLPVAYAVSQSRVHWFFPAMLLLMSGRYLTYRTVYGMRVFWFLGGLLALVAYLVAAADAAPWTCAFAVAAIEMAFSARIYVTEVRGGDPVGSAR
jgi:hypothetical protein